MIDTNNTTSSLLNDIGITQPKDKIDQSDQNQFLQLFVAQLQNQNPLEPQEGADFLAQLAQFSTVEGITNMEKSIAELTNVFSNNFAVQAASLVGKGVEVNTDQTQYVPGNLVKGSIDLPQTVANLQIEVINSVGEVVKNIQAGLQEKGFVPFTWDGTNNNGDPEPGGTYKIRAIANVGEDVGQFDTYMSAPVNSVTISKDSQDPVLNVDGVGPVSLQDIRSIS